MHYISIVWNDLTKPVAILKETFLIFDKMSPDDPLVDREENNIGEPEENVEQRHVHVVVVTIIDKSSIRVFQEDKPKECRDQL